MTNRVFKPPDIGEGCRRRSRAMARIRWRFCPEDDALVDVMTDKATVTHFRLMMGQYPHYMVEWVIWLRLVPLVEFGEVAIAQSNRLRKRTSTGNR